MICRKFMPYSVFLCNILKSGFGLFQHSGVLYMWITTLYWVNIIWYGK